MKRGRLVPLILIFVGLARAEAQDPPVPPVQPRATGARILEVRQDPDKGVLVVFDRGKRQGLELGDRFALLRREQRYGVARVRSLSRDVSVAEVLQGAAEVRRGDVAVRLKRSETPAGQGSITAVEIDRDSVLISLGRRDKVKKGEILDVRRLDRVIAELEAVEVLQSQCRARIVHLRLGNDLRVLSVGDLVVRRGASGESKLDLSALARRSADLRGRARRLRGESEALLGEARAASRTRASALRARAEQMRSEARRTDEQAAALERQIAAARRRQAGRAAATGAASVTKIRGLSIAVSGAGEKARLGVTAVEAKSVTGIAGVRPGDVIEHINGALIESVAELKKRMEPLKRGETVYLGVRREERPIILIVRPASGGAG